jgi:glutamate-ammonia-ligase adenylyltransferase
LDNRYGAPLELDAKGRKRPSDLCIVSLGKLGSRELNYSSDIDLLFIYSADGSTTGNGTRGVVTNREYFVKLAESIIKLVGQQTGEGAAYRVDLRLRPHGRVGSLALSLDETIRYYKIEAHSWERQVLIRSRSSAGESRLFRTFFEAVENEVFSATGDVETALRNVFRSKQQIDFEHKADREFDVKLGRGGIREIEFIAQALQLSYAGKDKWLRAPHTLISLSRLADRGLLSETELTGLYEGYDFLRPLEHILQMENGLQTHSLPNDPDRRSLIAKRMRCAGLADFEEALAANTENIHKTFVRVFGENVETEVGSVWTAPIEVQGAEIAESGDGNGRYKANILQTQLFSSLEKAGIPKGPLGAGLLSVVEKIIEVSPKFTELLTAKPLLVTDLKIPDGRFPERNYREMLSETLQQDSFGAMLAAMRTTWSQMLLEIAVHDIFGKLDIGEIKGLQTRLAEASVETALNAARRELANKLETDNLTLPVTVLGLGKLGSGALDYDSDLDLVLICGEQGADGCKDPEIYGRAVEIFVTTLSSMTRDGNLYRVDLRLRPHGKYGPGISTVNSFIEYINCEAAIWELLAYVQMRAVTGDISMESDVAAAIQSRAAGEDPDVLREESKRIRLKLEAQHGSPAGGKDVDIKFGPGGLLDVYFVVRFLHLIGGSGADANRSTAAKLQEFRANKIISEADFIGLAEGYSFLSELDHNIRLMIGRVSTLPRANQPVLERIAARMNLNSAAELIETLTIHRLNIRSAFENIMRG